MVVYLIRPFPVYRSDDEEEADKGAARTDMHFGGFLTKSEDGGKHMSGKDFMEELVAQSKMKKVWGRL